MGPRGRPLGCPLPTSCEAKVFHAKAQPMDKDADSAQDTLNDIGVLRRREIEARIVTPLIKRLTGVRDRARPEKRSPGCDRC